VLRVRCLCCNPPIASKPGSSPMCNHSEISRACKLMLESRTAAPRQVQVVSFQQSLDAVASSGKTQHVVALSEKTQARDMVSWEQTQNVVSRYLRDAGSTILRSHSGSGIMRADSVSGIGCTTMNLHFVRGKLLTLPIWPPPYRC